MRIPISVVIPLCLGVVGGVWWFGTRDRDFLKPPSEHELELIREKVSGSLPPANHPDDLTDAAEKPAQTAPIVSAGPKPARQVEEQPNLAYYRDQAVKGAVTLEEQALLLESRGQSQKSLLVWERILDSTTPDETRTLQALHAIKRLRAGLPEWDANAAAVTLHASTGKRTATILAPVLEEVARDLEQASSGILRITSRVHAGHDDIPVADRPAPVSLWFSGPNAESSSTEVLVFTVGPPETLRQDVLKNLFKVIRSYLGRTASLIIPEAVVTDEPPIGLIQTHVTRLGWLELGSHLNKTLE